VAELLESYARINPDDFDLTEWDYDTDVLVVGAGSAGLSADSNSMMAQGGIQAADQPDDSPVLHYLDVIGGGHFDNKPELVRALVTDGPDAIKWLEELGVMFDKNPDGSMMVAPGGGTCRKRMHSARDYTGAAICRVLRDEVYNNPDKIKYVEYTAIVELIKDDSGQVVGAIGYHLETKKYCVIRAKAVIIATGGFGRLHIQGFETTNHYGATADGLVIAYRAGANLLYMDSVQYHPTGAVFPQQILGFLCTEKLRSLGAQPVNKDGELFVYPLEPRDVEAAAFIRECTERGKGAMARQFRRFDIDITRYPILVYPTLHYQNGGIEINDRAETSLPGLYVAGEASGGVHGRNRLMGNSQLDLIVFGRRAGFYAAEHIKSGVKIGRMSLEHVKEYEKEVEALGVDRSHIAPIILPNYIPDHVRAKQKTAEYFGTLL